VAYHQLSGTGVTVSIYFYTLGFQVPDGLESELLTEHFKTAVREVVYFNENVCEKTCSVDQIGCFGIQEGEPDYLTAEFCLGSEAEGASRTILHLKAYDGRFLKIRQTMPDNGECKRQGIALVQEFTNGLGGQRQPYTEP
jgi:hypothetical protein